MEVSITDSPATSLSPTSTDNTINTDVVSKDAFLKLLVAQLEHQDPLSPMENVEFTAQLAQFSTLEQIEEVNTTLGALVNMQSAGNNAQVAGFIGKVVTAEGNSVRIQSGETSSLRYTLDANSSKVKINITDDAGRTIRTIETAAQLAGEQVVEWDGRDAQGNTLPDGSLYHYNVVAEDQAGNVVPAETMMEGVVEGVEYDENSPFLIVNGNRVEISALISVNREEQIQPDTNQE